MRMESMMPRQQGMALVISLIFLAMVSLLAMASGDGERSSGATPASSAR